MYKKFLVYFNKDFFEYILGDIMSDWKCLEIRERVGQFYFGICVKMLRMMLLGSDVIRDGGLFVIFCFRFGRYFSLEIKLYKILILRFEINFII